MPRLPNLTKRDDVPEPLLEAYDRVAAARQGTVSGPYGILLHSPELAHRAAVLGEYTRWNSVLSRAQTETAVLAIAREMDANVMWASHVRIGTEAGVPAPTIEVIANAGDLSAISSEESSIVAYVRELLGPTHRVSDATFEAARSHLGEQGVVDLTGLLGYYAIVGYTLNAFEVEPPAGSPELPPRS
ncbi:MAG: carboxymuconolactone decarboxylase family protein [Dehalococcoidia bacterium]|nr:carboxymuconolactone decarboxylase family protein [Dehalococcoidia bacterium]